MKYCMCKQRSLYFVLKIFLPVFFEIFSVSLFSVEIYPEIMKLNMDDTLFKQYSDDVLSARKAIAIGKTGKELPLNIYIYKAKKEDSVIRIAARCSVPYDGIITLNRIQSVEADLEGKYILLPTLPGIYLPEEAESPTEKLTAALFEKIQENPLKLSIFEHGKKRSVYCFPNTVLDGTIRAFFLYPFYRFPLTDGILTSGFGKRPSPFTGRPSYHPGIDLAAPTGSPVFACTSGTIKETGFTRIYGKYIILAHTDGRESLYGHLSAVLVRLNEKVKSGTIIGRVGSTGMSTGPHLHFEIRVKGIPKNPSVFIEKLKNKNESN